MKIKQILNFLFVIIVKLLDMMLWNKIYNVIPGLDWIFMTTKAVTAFGSEMSFYSYYKTVSVEYSLKCICYLLMSFRQRTEIFSGIS